MSVPYHPPAAGGKTAWGVGDLITTTGEDTEELQRRRKAAGEFNDREQKRLHSLRDLDSKAEDIQAARRERQRNWEANNLKKSEGGEDFKSKQLEILRKLEENKLKRKLERKEKKKLDTEEKKKTEKEKPKKKKESKKKKKKKKKSSSSSSSSSSASGSSSSSSSSSGKKKKDKKQQQTVQKKVGALIPVKPTELTAEQKIAQAEAKRRADEAKAKQREIQQKAKEQLKAFEAEAKLKASQDEAKKQADERRKAAERQARIKEEANKKKEDEEAKKNSEEAKKNSEAALARKKAAEEAAASAKAMKAEKGKSVREPVAGGFYQGQHVVATQDITIRGSLIVRNGTAGTIICKAETDPVNRISVRFVPRVDGGTGCLNCVPKEIRKG